jgi:acyl CoA:acetate/3-ketoacid CoA transferase beta subunit
MIGGRLARATFEPDLVMTDGYATFTSTRLPVGVDPYSASDGQLSIDVEVEAWNPYQQMFGVLWNGKRHVVMGATQIDRYGNQNFACVGDYHKPKAQLLGFRGAPGNTINHTTSYFVGNHSTRVLVEKVDVVCGIGYDRARALGPVASRFHEIRRLVTNPAVLDFETPDNSMRLRSVHPGVTVDEVVEATGFELAVPDDVPTTREPTEEELRLIREELDPNAKREAEVRDGGSKAEA